MNVLPMVGLVAEAPITATVRGVEQRTEAFERGKVVARPIRRRRGCRGGIRGRAQDHPRVDRDCATDGGDHGIHVDFGDGVLAQHQAALAADLHQGVDDGAARDRGRPAGAVEQRRPLEVVEHRGGLARIDGAQAEAHVAQHLDEDSPEAHHHHRAELRIADRADHDFQTGWRHFLDEVALDRCGGDGRQARHRVDRPGDRGAVREPDRHPAGVALVEDVGGDDLHHERGVETGDGRRRLFGAGGDPGTGDVDAVPREQSLAFALGQGAAAGGDCGGED